MRAYNDLLGRNKKQWLDYLDGKTEKSKVAQFALQDQIQAAAGYIALGASYA